MHYQIKTMMKLFSIFVVFMQIQVALSSQPIRYATEPKPIQELCKFNINPSLCVSTLNLDPRSKNSNLRGEIKKILDYVFFFFFHKDNLPTISKTKQKTRTIIRTKKENWRNDFAIFDMFNANFNRWSCCYQKKKMFKQILSLSTIPS